MRLAAAWSWAPRYTQSVLDYCWRCWRHRILAWVATATAVGAVLSLASSAELLLVLSERSLTHQLRSASEYQVFLADGAQGEQVQQLRNRVAVLPGVRKVSVRTKAEALGLARNNPALARIADDTATNPFPASLVVELESPAVAERVAAVAMQDPAVDRQVPTSYTPDQARRLSAALSMAHAIVVGIAMAALAVASLVGLVLLRSEIRARRAELRILALVGTPRPVIRLPVLVEAVSLALAGTIVATLTLIVVSAAVIPNVNAILPFLQLGSAIDAVASISLATLASSVLALGVCSLLVRLPR